MRCITTLLTVGACMAVFFSGCAKPPEEELAAAKAAFKAARDAEADKYMVNNFPNLQKAMEAAEEEVMSQKSKFALSQNYNKAKQLLKNATELAGQLAADAPKAKEELRIQVEKGLPGTQQKVKEARADLKVSSKSKEKKVVLQMMADLDQADNALVQAAADFAAGNLPEAAKKISNAQGLLKKTSDKLSSGGLDGLM